MKLAAKRQGHMLGVFDVSEGRALIVGASASADCRISGEPFLSRMHITLSRHGDRISVEKLPDARNPVVFKGSMCDRFELSPGEFFVIGDTMFQLEAERASSAKSKDIPLEAKPDYQLTIPPDELRARGGRQDRMRLLDLMELPEVLRTKTRTEFYIYACGLLRLAAGAQWVRVLTCDGTHHTVLAEDAGIDRATDKPVSQALVDAAVKEAPKPVAYSWKQSVAGDLSATAHEGVDWAVCCAMPVPGEVPVLVYLAGTADDMGAHWGLDTQSGAGNFLRDTARLVGLVADMIGRAMALQKVEQWQTRLGRFFSGKLVSRILEAEGTDELAPKIAEATVMFFDIRGFSKLTENNLERILEYEGDLRRVLTAMTDCVHDHEGVVLRYMGDGMLACWNVPYAAEKHVERACEAAIDMVARMAQVSDNWACGIGLSVGQVVAGSLGSEQIYAYDILGAVANLAARVEGITKSVGVPILVTSEVAERVTGDSLITRRVGRFRPLGMETIVDLFTIDSIPPDAPARNTLTERLAIHARGLESFEKGDWERAFEILHPIVQDDAAARYIYKLALQGKPPRDWQGIVELTAK